MGVTQSLVIGSPSLTGILERKIELWNWIICEILPNYFKNAEKSFFLAKKKWSGIQLWKNRLLKCLISPVMKKNRVLNFILLEVSFLDVLLLAFWMDEFNVISFWKSYEMFNSVLDSIYQATDFKNKNTSWFILIPQERYGT